LKIIRVRTVSKAFVHACDKEVSIEG
jgi:hypothetical protein